MPIRSFIHYICSKCSLAFKEQGTDADDRITQCPRCGVNLRSQNVVGVSQRSMNR